MDILVCVKQVPFADIAGNPEALSGRRQSFQMNRNDLYAVEEAVLVKGKKPGVRVDAITAGPESAAAVLRKSLEMGADNGIHVLLDESAGTDSSEVHRCICDYISEKSYDIIITGTLSEDSMQGEMGGLLAGKLDLPFAYSVMRMEPDFKNLSVRVESEIEGGSRIVYTTPLPAVISVQTGINNPSYPTLTNKLRARKQELIIVRPGPDVSPAQAKKRISFRKREKSVKGITLEGAREQIAERLLFIFYEKRLLR